MSLLRVNHYLGCCKDGIVKKVYQPWEEVSHPSDYELYHCTKCGKEDFLGAFQKMKLENNQLYCPHCQETTEHKLYYFDWFGGNGETVCQKCENTVEHYPTEEEIEAERKKWKKETEAFLKLIDGWD